MKLVVLDPGHFHAALLQKTMYADVDATVHVYAEEGPDLADYLQKIGATTRGRPTRRRWRIVVHAGPDFLDRFSADRAGNVAVIAGNNRRKTEYLTRAIEAGMHVLADKPMAIDAAGFESLRKAFALARREGRAALRHHDRAARDHHDAAEGVLAHSGGVRRAAAGHRGRSRPSSRKASTTSPSSCRARRSSGRRGSSTWRSRAKASSTSPRTWSTSCSGSAFRARSSISRGTSASSARGAGRPSITPGAVREGDATAELSRIPAQGRPADGNLHAYANGEIDYRIKGVHAKVSVLWNFEAPEGAGDTHFSVMRGSKANLVIRQGAAEALAAGAVHRTRDGRGRALKFASALQRAMREVRETYPGVDAERAGDAWQVVVPASYHVGHEAHFAQVAAQFLGYVEEGALARLGGART